MPWGCLTKQLHSSPLSCKWDFAGLQREAGHLFRVSRPALKFLPTSRNWLSVINRVSGAQYNYAANDVNSYYATSSKLFFLNSICMIFFSIVCFWITRLQ